MNYINLISIELTEIIISYFGTFDLEKFISSNLIDSNKINWYRLSKYRFNNYTTNNYIINNYKSYIKYCSANYIIFHLILLDELKEEIYRKIGLSNFTFNYKKDNKTSIDYLLNAIKLSIIDKYNIGHNEQEEICNITNNIFELITYLDQLESLDLSNNFISIIPRKIENLINLKELNLSTNWINTIPINIDKLEKLEILNLNNNKIRYITNNVSKIKSLKLLDLRNNQIPKLQDIIVRIQDHVNLLY